jgi:hypothetical protein
VYKNPLGTFQPDFFITFVLKFEILNQTLPRFAVLPFKKGRFGGAKMR